MASAPTAAPNAAHRVVHLARRFFASLSRRPPAVEDEVWAKEHLLADEESLWVQMRNHDRRHAIEVARRYEARRPGASRAEMAGVLLHDVGKVDSDLGIAGRVVATVVGPRGRRLRSYHDHERIGAAACAAAGSDPTTVALVAGTAEAAMLEALRSADDI